jgi:hypothetical protein
MVIVGMVQLVAATIRRKRNVERNLFYVPQGHYYCRDIYNIYMSLITVD